MIRPVKAALLVATGILLPFFSTAQIAEDIQGLNGVLDQLYDEMMPLCSKLIGVGQGLAGFAALWYIASRVWKHLSNAEPIDFYPLLRPFGIGLCIMLFPAVIAVINGVMKPTVTGTAAMVEGSKNSIALALKQKEEALKKTDKWQMYVGDNESGNKERWYKYTYGDAEEGWLDGIANDIQFSLEKTYYNFRNSVKQWMSEVLQVLFEAAALCINTLRTFQLVVLAILGPLVFGLAVFDGFQHTLTVWLARYINIFLWLPVANIFSAIIGKIQENMIKLDVRQISEAGDTFFSSTDIGYLIFMLIGIVGYFTVPSVANYIVNAGGGGALGSKVTSMSQSMVMTSAGMASQGNSTVAGHIKDGLGMSDDALGNQAGRMSQGMASHSSSSPYFSEKLKGNS